MGKGFACAQFLYLDKFQSLSSISPSTLSSTLPSKEMDKTDPAQTGLTGQTDHCCTVSTFISWQLMATGDCLCFHQTRHHPQKGDCARLLMGLEIDRLRQSRIFYCGWVSRGKTSKSNPKSWPLDFLLTLDPEFKMLICGHKTITKSLSIGCYWYL